MKRWLRLLIAVCILVLAACPAAFAQEVGNGGAPSVEIDGYQFNSAQRSCAFDVKLSGGDIRGTVFAALYAESGQMKDVVRYGAKETNNVKFQDVESADYVKAIWLDENQCPLAQGERNYQAFASAASAMLKAFSQFSADALDIDSLVGVDGIEADFATARLIVSADETVDLSGFDVAQSLTDPDGRLILQFASPAEAKRCHDHLMSLDSINYAEADRIVKVNPQPGMSADSLSWGVDSTHIGAYAANLAERGVKNTVVVAVIDTGVDKEHALLADRITSGYDFVDDDDEPQDGHSHGTHVSGTIVDCTPGMNVKIMPVRVLGNSGGGTDLNVGLGIRYAADHGANVINMSLGGGESSYIDECVAYAISQNVTVVVAAGNETDDTASHCPAHIPACITVAAVDSGLERAYFSNFGDAVDVSAPGVNILSSVPGGGNASMSGTSMATPHVAAAAALLINDRGANQTPGQVSDALREAAKDLGDSGWDPYYGAGYLNMEPFITPVQDHDYQAFALDSNPNWKEAREICENMGGHLATITSQAEQDKVAQVAASGSKYAYWIGGTDEGNEGAWKWITGESWEYENWEPGEPDNTSGVTSTEENYLELIRETGKWNDLGLNGDPEGNPHSLSEKGFICEWDGVRPSYSVSYDANGGSGEMSAQTVSAGDSVRLKANEFRRDGYHFVNWNTKADGSGQSYAAQAALTVTGALTLYAHWEPDAGAYAVLYTDGELSFQNSDTPRKDKSYEAVYALDTLTDYALWYDKKDLIRFVTFTDKIRPRTTALWFYGCENLTDVQGLENLDTSGVTNMSQMFALCDKLERLDLSALDTRQVTNMNAMFFSCGALKELDITGFDTANVKDMGDMFKNCGALSAIFASASFVTSNVANGADMFKNCLALSGDNGTAYSADHTDASYAHLDGGPSNPGYFSDPNTDGIFALLYTDGEMVFQNGREPRRDEPVAHTYTVARADSQSGNFAQWYDERNDILSVTFAETIRPATTALWFCDCVNLKKVSGLEKLDVSAVTNMSQMFSRCEKLTELDLSAWDVSNVTNMDSLFFSCSALETANVSGWNTENLASAKDMFKNCGNLRTIYATISFTTQALENSGDMFRDCNALAGGRGTKFDAVHIDKAYARLDGGESNPGYFTGTEIMRVSFNANGGSGEMDDQIFYVGQIQILNANQFTRDGYAFKNWNTQADGSGASANNRSAIIYYSTGAETYYAQWEQTEQSFTVSFDSMGGSQVDSQTVREGEKATRPENPTKDGYAFDAWYLNSDGSGLYDFDAPVTSDLTLYAGWKEVPGDTLYAFLYDDGLLVIQSGSEPIAGKAPVETYVTDSGGYNRDVEEVYVAWYNDRAQIKSVQINGPVAPTSTALWFYGCANLKAVNGLENLDTSAVTDMSQMFNGCSGLLTLDLAGLNTEKVTNMSQMFYACSGLVSLDLSEFSTGALTDSRWMFSGCASLETIFASEDFVTDNIEKSEQMFMDCASLRGGKGTGYDDEVTDKTYARLDNPPDEPGYFTEDETGFLPPA